ncbi:hypothetical protein BpHYR1_021168 [Brachionus plicatilis]|uniref:Uncharacterized protein n=1 Tax=Brachionus plicatilis TaxID=10195 RepID=A0A3M7PLP6_BRAPC|nr:hypothetical protein BpHYR1_021168 [Brachionus plicatilis]
MKRKRERESAISLKSKMNELNLFLNKISSFSVQNGLNNVKDIVVDILKGNIFLIISNRHNTPVTPHLLQCHAIKL